MIADLRFALRLLRQSPVFAFVAVVSLALTIGANTALFSVINTLLLKALPYKDAERLVYVSEYWPHEPVVPGPPEPDFANWRAESKLLNGVAAYSGVSESLNLTGVGEPERIQRTLVTAGLLDLIGTQLALGRNFTQEEDRPGGRPVVILGYSLWQRKFGASPDVIGKAIRLANDVGLAPAIAGHYVQNIGNDDLAFLTLFKSGQFVEFSLDQWLRRIPVQMTEQHLRLSPSAIARIPAGGMNIFPR